MSAEVDFNSHAQLHKLILDLTSSHLFSSPYFYTKSISMLSQQCPSEPPCNNPPSGLKSPNNPLNIIHSNPNNSLSLTK